MPEETGFAADKILSAVEGKRARALRTHGGSAGTTHRPAARLGCVQRDELIARMEKQLRHSNTVQTLFIMWWDLQ